MVDHHHVRAGLAPDKVESLDHPPHVGRLVFASRAHSPCHGVEDDQPGIDRKRRFYDAFGIAQAAV